MRTFMQLGFQMVLCALTVVGQGLHTVFKDVRTCCVADIAGVTLD